MIPSLRVGGDWRIIVVMLSSSSLMTILFGALGPVLPAIAAEFNQQGHGALVAQMIMTMPSIGIILGGPVSGWLIERLGVRPVMLGGLAAYGAAGSAGLYVDGAAALLASRFILGIAVASHATGAIALIGQYSDEGRRARMLGYQGTCAGVAGVSALLIAGAVAEFGGWRAPFAIYLIAIPILALALVSVPKLDPLRIARVAGRRDSLMGLWPIYAMIVPLYIALFMNAVQVSFLLQADGISSPAMRSWIIACASVASGGAGAIFGWLILRAGRRQTLALLLGFMGAGYGVMALSSNPVVTALGCGTAGFGGGMISPFVSSLLLARAPLAARGRAIGLMYTALYLGDFLNPVVAIPLRDWIGIHGAFGAVGVLLLAVGLTRLSGGKATGTAEPAIEGVVVR